MPQRAKARSNFQFPLTGAQYAEYIRRLASNMNMIFGALQTWYLYFDSKGGKFCILARSECHELGGVTNSRMGFICNAMEFSSWVGFVDHGLIGLHV